MSYININDELLDSHFQFFAYLLDSLDVDINIYLEVKILFLVWQFFFVLEALN